MDDRTDESGATGPSAAMPQGPPAGSGGGPDPRKRALVIAGVVAVVVLIAAGAAWALSHSGAAHEEASGETPEIEHALPTEPATSSARPNSSATTSVPSGGATSSGSGASGGAGGAPAGGSSGGSAIFHRNPVIAFRLEGFLDVSGEDGTGMSAVVPSASGVFSLSPDGRSLAYVDMAARELLIVDVATGAPVSAGSADQVVPVWSPSSEWVLFSRTTAGTDSSGSGSRTEVVRASRRGGRPEVVADGRLAAVSADARTLVIAQGPGDRPDVATSLEVIRDGRTVRELEFPGPVTGLATDGTRAYVAESHVGDPSQQAQDGVWVVPLDGGATSRLVGLAPSTRPVQTRSLILSPDGSRLMYEVTGDDGYSRPAVVPTSGGSPTELTTRRDAYVLGWSADGSQVFLIEGNPWQGEATVLVRMKPDGSGRVALVQGAEL